MSRRRAASAPATLRLMFRHILPQCVAPYLILATTHLGVAIVIEASLGFLGVGIPPPEPTWGNMLSDALNAGLVPPWWLVLFPGVRDHADGARLQPAGRRHPRPARPAAAGVGVIGSAEPRRSIQLTSSWGAAPDVRLEGQPASRLRPILRAALRVLSGR